MSQASLDLGLVDPHSTFRVVQYSLFSYSNGLLHTNFYQNPCGFASLSLFLLSLCSLLPICLATSKVCSAKNGTGKDSAPQTSLLDFPIVPFAASLCHQTGLHNQFPPCLLVKPVLSRLSCRFPNATRAQISTFLPSIIH